MNLRILVFAALLASSGCSGAQEGAAYFPPIPAGGRLEYAVLLPGSHKETMWTRRDSDETIQGRTYMKYVSVISGIPGADPVVNYYRHAPEGIYRVDGKHKDAPEFLETPLPLTVGATWVSKGPEEEYRFTAEAIETVELVDRTYKDCLKLSTVVDNASRGTHTEVTSYLAPDIGAVRVVARANGMTMELLRQGLR